MKGKRVHNLRRCILWMVPDSVGFLFSVNLRLSYTVFPRSGMQFGLVLGCRLRISQRFGPQFRPLASAFPYDVPLSPVGVELRRFCRVQVPPPTPPCTPEPQQVQGHHEQQRQYQQQQWQFAWQSRELCLHYFSNSVKFKFGQDTHDVYRVDQIKEWAELENPIWLDNLREKLFAIAGQFHSHMCQNELMQPGALKLCSVSPLPL